MNATPSARHHLVRSLAFLGWLAVAGSVSGGEIDLKSVETIKQEQGSKRKYGPYVGLFAGEGQSQDAEVMIGGLPYPLDHDSASQFGLEVGYSWRAKKWPLALSVEFEGMFQSTQLSGEADALTIASLPGTGLVSYRTDMNSVFFMFNGTLSLDLYRYRARIGKVLAGMRPYIGGGIGGGQIWFRDTATQSKDQFTGVNPLTAADQNPFSIDEFVGAWQWFGGIEYCYKDKYSLFAEYRELHVGDLEDMNDYVSRSWTGGFRYRY